ncbi:MAG: NAD(P)/FAD-dependent oxidoreductase [Rhodobiaceae bacterium]|nr:NAD(P)/FAD-dependent oxidoreductase [Rhodobiaceae bacterium]MCC0049185.1 NAD(P)/FAD-dependent oxidoreductase [Rhodobiaceae bacterium]
MEQRDASDFDTVILGAGAAGMMCAAHAGAKGGRVLVVDHAKAPGEKIRISGGGRCNFTNLDVRADRFISANPHFAKSALSRYTQHDFIALVRSHGIPFHEKTLGQLFCDTSAKDIIAMLLTEMERAGARLWLNATLESLQKTERGFALRIAKEGRTRGLTCRNFVVACGGKSIPKMGATGFGYRIAQQFGHAVTETRPGLVPLTFGPDELAGSQALAGVARDARVSCNGTTFDEAILFTHRGLSGPAILQISSYWREGQSISVDLAPGTNVLDALKGKRAREGRKNASTVLSDILPKRLASEISERSGLKGNLADMNDKALARLGDAINRWRVQPTGTEGYRTAEVTLGGVDTAGLNSRTMESKTVPGLYVIGEAVDVTGWLGGYNFQWAWSSGWAAGTAIAG